MAVPTDEKSKSNSNGIVKGPRGANGVNGTKNINGHSTAPRQRATKPKRRSFFAWSFNIVARYVLGRGTE